MYLLVPNSISDLIWSARNLINIQSRYIIFPRSMVYVSISGMAVCFSEYFRQFCLFLSINVFLFFFSETWLLHFGRSF